VKRTRIKWRIEGFRELRLAAQPLVEQIAQDVAETAGEGYEALSTESPRNRARAAVVTADARAMADNARNQTLLRALDANRR
jgi:hypothetical protein